MQKMRCFCIVLLLPLAVVGQSSKDIINVSAKEVFFSIDSLAASFVDSTHATAFLDINPSRFKPGMPDWRSPYPKYISFSFRSKKETTLYLFGEENAHTKIYQTTSAGHYIKQITPQDYTSASATVFPLVAQKDSVSRFVIRTELSDNTNYGIRFWVVQENQLDNFFHYYHGTFMEETEELWVMAGMLLMMFLYIGSKFIQLRSAEYGYYAAYIIFLFAYVSFRIVFILNPKFSNSFGDWYFYVNNQLQIGAYAMYFPFLTAYLNTKTKKPFIHRLLIRLPLWLVGYVALDGLLIYYEKIEIHFFVWNAIRAGLLLVVLYVAYHIYKMKTPYGLYPIIGGLALDFFGLIAMVLTIVNPLSGVLPVPFSFPIFYYFVGIVIELLFFSLGLGYKNKQDEIDKIEAHEALKLAAEQQKFEQYKTVVEVQESERARIAKDLHDGVGGTLSGIKISLTNLLPHLTLSESQQLQFDRSVDLLDSSVHELRKVSHNMMPPSLTQFGLASALRDYCDSVNGMKTIYIAFQVIGPEIRQPVSREIIIYRIVQELINNTVKHAQAGQALVEIAYDQQVLSVTVEDNGKGFDTSLLPQTKSAGWKNIHSRINFLLGRLDLRSSPSGTSVHVQVPILQLHP